MGVREVGQFLEFVAQTDKDPVRALAGSRDALDFLYHEVLHSDLGELPLPRPPRLLDQVRQVLLAVQGRVAASTQNQALNALVSLYKQVLEIDRRFQAVRANRAKRLPVVLNPEEVGAVLSHVEGAEGAFRLMAGFHYHVINQGQNG
jgi:hypothetical protein